MARRGDGIYLRGRTWWLDFTHKGGRHVERLGKGINRTVAGELASVRRAAVLKAEAGIGSRRQARYQRRLSALLAGRGAAPTPARRARRGGS